MNEPEEASAEPSEEHAETPSPAEAPKRPSTDTSKTSSEPEKHTATPRDRGVATFEAQLTAAVERADDAHTRFTLIQEALRT